MYVMYVIYVCMYVCMRVCCQECSNSMGSALVCSYNALVAAEV